MKSTWPASLLVVAAIVLLIASNRAGLLLIAPPMSLAISWFASRKRRKTAA